MARPHPPPSSAAAPRSRSRALLRAAASGEAARVASLLAGGADAAARDDTRATPLILAARGGHASCVEALLPLSDHLARDAEGCTALLGALIQPNRCFDLLLPRGDARAIFPGGLTIAHHAAMHGRIHALRLLRSTGAPFWEPDYFGRLPLDMAAAAGQRACVSLLLDDDPGLGPVLSALAASWRQPDLELRALLASRAELLRLRASTPPSRSAPRRPL